jgi:hypothetical protein
MRTPLRLTAVATALLLVLAACGGADDDSAQLPPNDAGDDGVAIAGACIEDEPDCQDTIALPGADEPIDLPVSGEPDGGGGRSVGEATSSDIDGPFAIRAFYLQDAGGAWLCDALAESFPPQCGGDRVAFDNSAGVDLGPLQQEQATTWSDDVVVVVGEMVDGVFVATSMSG